MRLPYFSRSQLGVALLLGAALLFLWAWRGNFWLAPSPPPAQSLAPVFVEVTGAAAHPGVYKFDHPPTLAEVWRRAGASPPAPADEVKLASGARVEIAPDGAYHLGRMSGEALLTLGLALDLNTATAADLEALPGIGPALARRIIDYRQSHGPFQKIDDLLEVSGIGPHNLEKLKPFLVLGIPETNPPNDHEPAAPTDKPASVASPPNIEVQGSRPASRRAQPKKTPDRPLNPNLASLEELQTLPGIGPVLAQRIIDYRRAHGLFKKADDLERVSGIGPKKLEKLKPYLTVNGRNN